MIPRANIFQWVLPAGIFCSLIISEYSEFLYSGKFLLTNSMKCDILLYFYIIYIFPFII